MKSSSATNIPLKKLYPDGRYPGPFVNDEPTKMPKNPPLPPRRPKQDEDTSSSDETLEDMKAKSDAMKMKKGGSVSKVSKVMKEFKSGKLHSGSKAGPAVTSKKQAIAIALSEAKSEKKAAKGGWIKEAISSPGALRKSTKTPAGKNISSAALAKAAKSSNPTTAKRANLAKTLRKINKGK